MSDGFDDDSEELAAEIIKQQQAGLKEQQEDVEFMETLYDFHKYTANPALKRLSIEEIDKNWVFGNYSPKDEEVIALCESLISDVEFLLPEGTDKNLIKTSIFRDIFSRITLSRGRKGFAAELFVSQIGRMGVSVYRLYNE